MRKLYIDSTGELILPKKYLNKYPLRITTAWTKTIIYHKKSSLWKSEVTYCNTKNKPYIEDGLIKINDEVYQLELFGKRKK